MGEKYGKIGVCRNCIYCLLKLDRPWNEGDERPPFCLMKELFTPVDPEDYCDEKDAAHKYYFTPRVKQK